jgi:hypothetical protein
LTRGQLIAGRIYGMLASANAYETDGSILEWLKSEGLARLTVCPECQCACFEHAAKCSVGEMTKATSVVLNRNVENLGRQSAPGNDPPETSMTATVPNPATRSLRPVHLITDRAKRYRANRTPPPGPRVCAWCKSKKNVGIDHIDGDESNGHPKNLQWLCKRHNAEKAVAQIRAGIGAP